MNEYSAATILTDIEQAIEQEPPYHPEPMRADRWLLMSALQKAIRRGKIEQATRIAASLICTDKRRFFARLPVIAAEDIGIGSPDVIVKVFTAAASSAWRRRVGEVQVGMYLTRLLCEAVKSRLADAAYILAERATDYSSFREWAAKTTDRALIYCIIDEDRPLMERCIACWYLAGTQKFMTDAMPQRIGTPARASSVLRSLTSPAPLNEACVSVMGQSRWPLCLFLPLIWQEAQKQPASLRVVHDHIPAAPEVDGIPICAVDMFTRIGQASVRQLQKVIPGLQGFSVKQVGLALFYIDGGRVDRRVTSDALEEFQRQGKIADAESAGLQLPEYTELRECLAANMQRLDDIRRELLTRRISSMPIHCSGVQS